MRSSILLKRMLPILLALNLALGPAAVSAGANIPGFYGRKGNLVAPAANTLPQIQSIVKGVSGLEQVGNSRLIVHQDEDKAIIDWKTFDIGANAWTHFDQQGNTNWSALNRIYDRNPSQIYGRLTADGSVYLINQNGMMFSQGATVDVHAMVASSLNIQKEDFLDDLLSFHADNYQGVADYDDTAVAVANHGTITTDENGSVMLLGPTVENNGAITAPLGRIILASGTDVTMNEKIVGAQAEFQVNADGKSQYAVNYPSGRLEANRGQVGMFGSVVNQDGLIRAITAIQKNGKIELKASKRLNIGADSLTESPISTSDESVHESFRFNGGEISFSSDDLIDFKGQVVAPGGTVSLAAGNRVYLDTGSRIDVSGSWVALPAGASVASAQLNSVELKDDYQQKESLLQGQKIYFNAVEGSGIGDISGTLTSEEKTALERSTAGGIIEVSADEGEVIARSGAKLDFSGGGIIYDKGFADTTVLVSGNRLYRIENAPAWIEYDTIIGPENPVSSTIRRFGISTSHDGTYHTGSANSVRNYHDSFYEGADAGLLDVDAPFVLVNADLDGSVTSGIYQIADEEATDDSGYQSTRGVKRPEAGRLLIGGPFSGGFWEDRDPVVRHMVLAPQKSLLPENFDPSSELPPEHLDEISPLSTEILNDAGLAEIVLSVREDIVVEADAAIQMNPTGTFTLAGRHIEHHGTISIPGGSVSLILASNLTSDAKNSAFVDGVDLGYERVFLAESSRIDVSGERVDLSAVERLNGPLPNQGLIAGGDVFLEDRTVSGEGIVVMPGAGIDVRGGWRIDQSGNVTGGDGGLIQMAGSTVVPMGDLRTHALADADGGTLNMHAEQVTVQAASSAPLLSSGEFSPKDPLPGHVSGHLVLSDTWIDETGATDISLKSVTDFLVADGARLLPSTLRSAGPDVGAKDVNGGMLNYVGEAATDNITSESGFHRVTMDQIHDASIYLGAGKAFGGEKNLSGELVDRNKSASVFIEPRAEVAVSPQ
ncbi:MAG: filamentous hemagglutinin N-terminal domain-containing protein, partial [Desulfobacteraceae bacterium]